MKKMKSRLAGSSSALALAVALFAFSFLFGAAPASAQVPESPSCTLTNVLDNTADVAEELDVLCHWSSAATFDVAAVDGQAAIETDRPISTAVEAIEPSSPDAASPQAIEGQAVQVEITQSVTVAVAGEDTDVTGSVTSLSADTEATAEAQLPE